MLNLVLMYLAFASSHTMSLNLLQIKNLSVCFTEHYNAVNQISFDIGKGEIIGLVGESGSGKSVTALSIMQLLDKNAATIAADEFNFFGNENEVLNIASCNDLAIQKIRGKEIAIIFQEPMTSLNPVFTCGEQVMEAILTHQKISNKEAKILAIEWLNKVELLDADVVFGKYPHQLSGGQKQRVMIAMAMCNQPKLLIADEPTTALDVTIQASIIELMKKLQSENGMSMLFISHDLELVANIANKIIVMKEGEIVEQGSKDEIIKNPKHYYTKALLACKPRLHVKYERLATISEMENSEFNAKEISLTNQKNKLTEIAIRNNVLEVKNVSIEYPVNKNWLIKSSNFKAISNISFEIKSGETLGLVGESGSGKTSIGKAIVGLNEISEGEILFNGKSIFNRNKKSDLELKKQLQFIFQDAYSSLNPRMKVGDAIEEGLKVHGLYGNEKQRKEKVMDWLQKVNLSDDCYYKFPHELSGGQRQRVVIARALALEPLCVIADEPVSNLDVSIQAQILNLLMDLKNEMNFSCLFISHDLAVVNFMSDRIMVMNNGKIEEINSAYEVLQNPQTDYTKKLLQSIPKSYS
jgi:peptide/nickel transport system ATP-binding protein